MNTAILLVFASFAVASAFGCSIFSLSKNGEHAYCNNEDSETFPSFLFTEPAGIENGKPTYAWLGFGFDQSTVGSQGGINSQGLVVDANALNGQGVNTSNGAKPPLPYQFSLANWLPFFLKHCANVAEVVALWSDYAWVIPAPMFSAQFHFMDSTGQSVVVGPDGVGGLFFVHRSPGTNYLISTNYNLFNPQLDAPLGYPCWRKEVLERMVVPKIYNEYTGQFTDRAMLQMLEAVSVIGYQVPGTSRWIKTVYSLVYHLNNMTVTLAVSADECTTCRLDVLEVMHLLDDGSGRVRQIPLEDACDLFDQSSSDVQKKQMPLVVILLIVAASVMAVVIVGLIATVGLLLKKISSSGRVKLKQPLINTSEESFH